MTYDTRLAEFKELISRIEYLRYTQNSLIYWDKITHMPQDGIEYRSKVMGFFADEQYKLLSSSKFRGHVRYFNKHKKNDEITDAMVRRLMRNSQFINRIPEEEYSQYTELITKSDKIWELAKKDNDFNLCKPYLEQIFEFFKKFATYWEYDKDPYDALMEYYVDDLSTEKIDGIIEEVKPFLIETVSKLKQAEEEGKLMEPLDVPIVDGNTQSKVWEMILSEIGFNFDAGRVDMGAHPTILANSPSDVRIVNSFREDHIKTGIFNVLHSGGKGIYQQSISKDLLGTLLAEVPSFAMEEAIGRFYENVLGRSFGFWTYFYDKIVELVPELKKYSVRQIYEDVNYAKPSKIRVEADELTYLLHIIIRYELEREIINGRLSVEELPDAWNEKYENYLGVKPKTDSEGVLQDIHWAAGYVGYFPTYLVSNMIASQLFAAIEKDCGNLDELMSDGKFDVINNWLSDNIFRHGAVYGTLDLLEKVTGEPLTSKHYIDYLRNKFSEVYKLI